MLACRALRAAAVEDSACSMLPNRMSSSLVWCGAHFLQRRGVTRSRWRCYGLALKLLCDWTSRVQDNTEERLPVNNQDHLSARKTLDEVPLRVCTACTS